MKEPFKRGDRVRVVRAATKFDWPGIWIAGQMDRAIGTDMTVVQRMSSCLDGIERYQLAHVLDFAVLKDPLDRGCWVYPSAVLAPASYGNEEEG